MLVYTSSLRDGHRPFLDIHDHGRLLRLSQEAEVSWPQDTFGDRVRLSDTIATSFVHLTYIAGYLGVAMIDVWYNVVTPVISALTLSNTSRARDLVKVSV
jgi:hypothetical protein